LNKTLCFILSSLGNGGAENVMEVLAYNHAKVGYRVVIINISGNGNLKRQHENLFLFSIGKTRFRHSFVQLINLIRDINPDVIYSSFGHINTFLVMMRSLYFNNARLILRESSSKQYKQKHSNRWVILIEDLLFNLFTRRSDYIVYQNIRLKNENKSRFSRCNYIVINNPVDLDFFHQLASTSIPNRIKSSINILSVGTLKKAKRFDILLKAIGLVVSNNKDYQISVKIVGDGEENQFLNDMIIKLNLNDVVEIQGFVENPYPYYRWADLYILSSENEASPNVLLEAMSFDVPIISTDCFTGPRDILGEDYPYLVEVDDSIGIANAVKDLIDSKYRPNYNLKEYLIESVMERYINMINVEINLD